jgi:hypothetical protein
MVMVVVAEVVAAAEVLRLLLRASCSTTSSMEGRRL